MESNENIVKVGLSQSLRERVTFETFATDEQKDDHKMLKEEPLKETFRHLWFANICNLIVAGFQSDDAWALRAIMLANRIKEFTNKLKEAGYVTLANKLEKSRGTYMLGNNITEEDLK